MKKIIVFILTLFIYSLFDSGFVIYAQEPIKQGKTSEFPQDYTVSYAFKNSDGTLFRVIKYYLLEGMKFRSEYYSFTSPIVLSAGVEAELQMDSATVKEEPKVYVEINEQTVLQAPDIINLEPHTILILRKDKNLVWSMDPSVKQYFEVPLQQDSWERSVTRPLIDNEPDLKKTGEMKLLDYQCNVYESVMLINESNWTSIIIAAQDVVLKRETWRNGDLYETMEVTEFNLEKPAASLFDVPHGYQKNESNQ
jgi:hypothetical protein